MKITLNPFVLRQTPESSYTHFQGSQEELLDLVRQGFPRGSRGYKPGVLLVPVPAEKFRTSTVVVSEDTPLTPVFQARREGEAKFLSVLSHGEKVPAQHAFVVLYSHEVLGDEASSDADWEVVSLNARETEEEEPMDPMTMARNFLCLPGGTQGDFTAKQFAESIIYWSQRVRVVPPKG